MKTKKNCISILLLSGLFFFASVSYLFSQEKDKEISSFDKLHSFDKLKWYEKFTPRITVLSYISGIDFSGKSSNFGKDSTSRQFNMAMNFEGEAYVKKNITLGYNIQTATGNDDIKFKEDPKLIITDLYIDFHNIFGTGFDFLTGSFDTPFGDQVNYVSNCGDTLRNPFLLNSLFFSAFGGEVGTLNTLGVYLHRQTDLWDMGIAITNGTDEESLNIDGNFEFVADLGFNFNKIFRVAGSFIKSDDWIEDRSKTGLKADLTAGIFDLKVNLPGSKGKSYIKGYYGLAKWGDKTSGTEDMLDFWMVEAKYTFLKYIYAAFRYSVWSPKDNNGDNAGISKALPSPSTALAETMKNNTGVTVVTDQDVSRYQLALGYLDSDKLNVKLLCFYDRYQHKSQNTDTDTLGIILAVNAGF